MPRLACVKMPEVSSPSFTVIEFPESVTCAAEQHAAGNSQLYYFILYFSQFNVLIFGQSSFYLYINNFWAKGGGSETEVTWEDQQNINKFGRLNNRFHELEDEIKVAKVIFCRPSSGWIIIVFCLCVLLFLIFGLVYYYFIREISGFSEALSRVSLGMD